MYFDSLQQLIFMDGHGVYVWSAFIISIVVMVGLMVKPLCQKKQEFKNIQLHIKLQQVNQAATQKEALDASHS
ncbi:MAG: heme exporter protein CcmD [Porticoccaceae bacterium]|nr:heme exporter protein CcmD [Porticoccaceae bacterium]